MTQKSKYTKQERADTYMMAVVFFCLIVVPFGGMALMFPIFMIHTSWMFFSQGDIKGVVPIFGLVMYGLIIRFIVKYSK